MRGHCWTMTEAREDSLGDEQILPSSPWCSRDFQPRVRGQCRRCGASPQRLQMIAPTDESHVGRRFHVRRGSLESKVP